MDDEESDDDTTQHYSDMRWVTPVNSVADLPTEGVEEGALCFVDAEQRIYQFVGGEWITSDS
jgi:hypothetical protein